jgi:predicted metal-dependent enzyme (double-stranded beta helix superfamily)
MHWLRNDASSPRVTTTTSSWALADERLTVVMITLLAQKRY